MTIGNGHGLLAWTDNVASATLSASSWVTGLDPTSLQDDHLDTCWQVPGLSATLDIDCGSAASWGVLALLGTNLTAAATITWTLGTTQGGTDVLAATSGPAIAAGFNQSVLLLAAHLSARWARLTLADSGNSDGYLRIGKIFGGPYWQPSRNFRRGRRPGRWDDGQVLRTRGGQEYPDYAAPTGRMDRFTLPALTEAEQHAYVGELDRIVGQRGNLLWVPHPDGTYLQREALFGRPTEAPESEHVFNALTAASGFSRTYQRSFVVRERK